MTSVYIKGRHNLDKASSEMDKSLQVRRNILGGRYGGMIMVWPKDKRRLTSLLTRLGIAFEDEAIKVEIEDRTSG